MIFDLSPPLHASIAVWPGDTPLTREVLLDMDKGDNLTLSTLRATVHLGAHADGPNHYGQGAASIGERSLEPYLGTCQVMHVDARPGQRLRGADLPEAVTAKRLLIRTGTHPDPGTFSEDFAALDPSLVDELHAQGVLLVGIDTPSVDVFSSKDLPSHARFLAHDMAILEGLVLDAVPSGRYELIALPLRLMGFDASPVRAVLRTLDARGPSMPD
jgi:arylformamidase